jgi:hypothetical protein
MEVDPPTTSCSFTEQDSSFEEVGPTIGDTSPINGVVAATLSQKVLAQTTTKQYDLNKFHSVLAAVLAYTPQDKLPSVETPPKSAAYTLSGVSPHGANSADFHLLPDESQQAAFCLTHFKQTAAWLRCWSGVLRLHPRLCLISHCRS